MNSELDNHEVKNSLALTRQTTKYGHCSQDNVYLVQANNYFYYIYI